MKIDKINIYKVILPFQIDFFHALNQASSANNIVVEILADNGRIRGYGECAPRPYVTGETQDSVCERIVDFLERNSFPWVLNSVSEIWSFIDSLPSDKRYNASVCAIEMSLLDLLGKYNEEPIIEYFPKDFRADTIYYGAPIPMADKNRILEICRFIKKMKIQKLKLKMGKDFIKNKETLETVDLVLGDDRDLKIDINGVWDLELAIKHTALIKQHNVRIV